MQTGVIEGFFGPQWPLESRLSYAPFLQRVGGSYYIYAPKQDPHLRKKWREPWDESYLSYLRSMVDHFHSHGIQFGVALSPFGLKDALTLEDINLLNKKIGHLSDLGIDLLGIFFDDMPVHENLAEVQSQVMKVINDLFKKKIIFCPTFYCFDPILEKVFGKKPDHYLEDIADHIMPHIALAWTGPKVISPEIPEDHLIEVNSLLRRKPFIWENLFANDGPRNCKFLKLKPFDGRSGKLKTLVESWGFNMMNQPELSKIVYLASQKVLLEDKSPEQGFDEAISDLCTGEFAGFLRSNRKNFLEEGLDKITESRKAILLDDLSSMTDPAALEVAAWLRGEYLVGSECLTD